jgi:glycosyltransferase involved in cell wall biosynthesis
LRVLHVYKTSMPSSVGGVESFIDNLCKAVTKSSMQNIVLTLHERPAPEPIKMSGYTVYQAKQNFFLASTGFSFSAFKLFRNLSAKADIIHYHYPNPFADLLHMTDVNRKPSIITYHSDIIKQKALLNLYKPLRNCFLSSVDHIIATSPNYFATSDVLKKYASKVSVIPIGIDFDHYQVANAKRLAYWKKIYPKPFFLFVGAMRYYKGLHIALEAAVGSPFQFIIAGSGELEKELKNKATLLNLDNVSFVGQVSDEDKIALLHLCYAFIFPSHLRSEAFGVSLLEAATVGKPMISCETGSGTSFVNINGETGVTIKPSSVESLKDAMIYLKNNPEVAKKMGKKAKLRSKKYFTIQQQIQAYEKLYAELTFRKF